MPRPLTLENGVDSLIASAIDIDQLLVTKLERLQEALERNVNDVSASLDASEIKKAAVENARILHQLRDTLKLQKKED